MWVWLSGFALRARAVIAKFGGAAIGDGAGVDQAVDSLPAEPPSLGSQSIEYLAEIAKDAYDQQAELSESVWRSLPFFAAVLGLAVTLLARASEAVPPPDWTPFTLMTNVLLWLAAASFTWAFRWMWVVVASQDYEYPSDQTEIDSFARQMAEYHAFSGLEGADLDARVLDELRIFRANQLGNAARTNQANNVRKLKARSQVLLFMMVGFVLAIATEATTYVHGLLFPV